MLSLLVAVSPVRAQEESTKLAALLERISFNNAEKPETLGKDLADLDAADLAKLCNMLVEPGTGDDTKPRMALHALTWYLGAGGTSEQRDRYIDTLCAALDSDKPTRVKAFFIRQLQLIGNARAVPTLSRFVQDDDLRPGATRALLTIRGTDAASAVGEKRPDSSTIPKPAPTSVHGRCAALWTLAQARGAQAADELVEAMSSENAEYRAAAMYTAIELSAPDLANALVKRLPQASAAARAGILEVLAARVDASAFEPAVRALKDDDTGVRLAAINAVAALGEEEAVKPLVRFLAASSADERKAAEDALTGLKGENVPGRIAAAIGDQPADVRAVLLNVLTRRRARAQLGSFYRLTGDENVDVRMAAIRGIGKLADETAAAALIPLLREAETDPEREAVELALVTTCNRAESPGMRAAPILGALEPDDAKNYGSLLRVLGRLGGEDALKVLQAAVRDDRADVRQAAIRAFLEWPDASAAEAVLQIARDVEDVKDHVLAMRAYARLISLATDWPIVRTLEMYAAGLDAARRSDERKLLLGNVANAKHVRTFRLLAPYLDDGDLREEAASAMITIADGLLPAAWAEVRPELELVLAKTQSESIRDRADDALERVAEFEDFITDWMVSGPYQQPGKLGSDLFDVPFAPEDGDVAAVEWKRQPVSKDPADFWHIDLLRSCGGSRPVGYLRTYVYSPETQEVRFEFGSDDGIKVWLDGEVIHANNVLRGIGRAQDKVTATLKRGWNELLLKITNNGGGWGTCARVRSAAGGPLDGLKTSALPQR